MKVIGITGNSGSGKSYASSILEKMNGYIIDLDKIGHLVYSRDKECYKEVVNYFSDEILTDFEIDRKKLSKIVFSDKEKLKVLTEITDKYIYLETKKIIEDIKLLNKHSFIVLDGALILDSKTKLLTDEIILISASFETKLNRLLKRDETDKQILINRLNSQQDFLLRKDEFSAIIYNEDEHFEENLKNEILKLIN